jgi:ABC-2 type transport system ATP-binding protein
MAMHENANLLELTGVSKSFKEPLTNPFKVRRTKQALIDVSLSIPRRKVSCLLGPNGAGKTTILKILASLIIPDSGAILFDGIPREKWEGSIQGRIGLVTPNERSFYWRLTGRQNLMFFGSLYSLGGKALKERVEESLTEANLNDAADKPYRLYSSGMKQKLNIARALIGHPDLFLLDEPATHLDPLAKEDFWELIIKTLIGKRGATVFLCTHDLEEARRLADLLIILNEGRVIDSGSLPELGAVISGRVGLEMRYRETIPPEWLGAYGKRVSIREPGHLSLALDGTEADQEEAIRSFVQGGGILVEAFRSQVDLLRLLNERIKRDA